MADPKVQFFYNFSTMLRSGVPIFRAIALAGGSTPGRCRRIARRMEKDVREGMSISDSMSRYPRFFDPMEIEIVRAGEDSGELSEILEELSRWCEFTQKLRRTFWTGMILPFLVLHGAVFGIPLIFFIRSIFLEQADISGFVRNVFISLGVYYLSIAVIVGIIFLTPKRGPLRRILDTFVCAIPVLGKAITDLSLSRYAKTFSMLYKAGVPIVKAAQQATASAGNWLIIQKLKGATESAQLGESMSQGFSRTLDAEFRDVWTIGEESGDLDVCSERLGNMYAERAERKFQMLARAVPFGIYLLLLISMGGLVIYLFTMLYGGIFRSFDI